MAAGNAIIRNSDGSPGDSKAGFVPSLPYALSFWRSVFPACDARKPFL
jgi:hypothetical protein